jgi:hypothetical protein
MANIQKLDNLLKMAKQIKGKENDLGSAYDWDRLTTEELIELSGYDGDCSFERMMEILEPVARKNKRIEVNE